MQVPAVFLCAEHDNMFPTAAREKAEKVLAAKPGNDEVSAFNAYLLATYIRMHVCVCPLSNEPCAATNTAGPPYTVYHLKAANEVAEYACHHLAGLTSS
jgi:hypothetical protein